MRYGVLGTGMVGQALARRLRELGHEVAMGAREASNEKARAFAAETGGQAMDFAGAAAFGEVIIHATSGAHALEALNQAGAENLAGKVLIDISNALDFSQKPPVLSVVNTDSLGETIQRAFPQARVVKTLCTVNAKVMVDPGRLPGEHVVFLSGNDNGAKKDVRDLLTSFGWTAIIDLGGIEGARAQEMMMPMWLRLWGHLGTPDFNWMLTRRAD
ncbi:NAD(P)-binding domain-containing protein [uncultured Devosia sp.]|uniref:NADPH-dependent F420 reductase n=1 Tax=uncultured Devosia sp. TaxID=211434 RepID=UPI002631ECB8|nr:NAD(P)-binding domain-containing protein [uncultured Devosia sp.]